MRKVTWALLAAACGWLLSAGAVEAERPSDLWTTVTKTSTADSTQTDTTLWTATSGKRIALQGCLVSTNRAVAVEFEVSDVDVVPPIYLESYGSVLVGGDQTLLYMSAKDATLTYTTTSHSGTAHARVSVVCWGYEPE